MKGLSGGAASVAAIFFISLLATPIQGAYDSEPRPTSEYDHLNFKATFGDSPAPFKIDVDLGFIEKTKLKAGLTRLAVDLDQPDFTDGVPSHNVSALRDHWVHKYDWFRVQEQLNAKFHHFTTTVHAGPDYPHPIPLHFVHQRSPRPDAIPLLFIHGWPGSFMEAGNIMDLLTNPPDSTLPAFHLVAPSLPGFAFSPISKHPGLGLRETGQGFHDLMGQLGYSKYVIQGGDFGASTLRYMAIDFPDSVVSVLSNEFTVAPNATDLERFRNNQTTPEETQLIKDFDAFQPFLNAYWGLESQRPLQIAISTTDSPVGNVAWMYDGMRLLAPAYHWGLEELITWSMMYYIQGPYGGLRMYKEVAAKGTFLQDTFAYIHQPVGVVECPADPAYGTPLDWCQRRGNVTYLNKNYTAGGHFPAYTAPRALAEDCWAFWGNDSLSGVSVFRA